MDQRLETTTVKLIATAAVILCMSTAMAQNAEPEAQDEPTMQEAEPKAGTSIFGSTALPKGLTIVPWKKAGAGQITSSPIRQVEVPLDPIDPAEFRRRLKYHQQAGASE